MHTNDDQRLAAAETLDRAYSEAVAFDARQSRLTNPYGNLTYSVGDADDFVCFDFAILSCGFVLLHAVVNSETGGFIQDFAAPYTVHPDVAEETAKQLAYRGMDWCHENEVFPIPPEHPDGVEFSDAAEGNDYAESLATVDRFATDVLQAVEAWRSANPGCDPFEEEEQDELGELQRAALSRGQP